jgi:hypothetical protein
MFVRCRVSEVVRFRALPFHLLSTRCCIFSKYGLASTFDIEFSPRRVSHISGLGVLGRLVGGVITRIRLIRDGPSFITALCKQLLLRSTLINGRRILNVLCGLEGVFLALICFLNKIDLLRLILFENWIDDWLIFTTVDTSLFERSLSLFRLLFNEVPFRSEYNRLRILSIVNNLDSWLIYLEFLTSWRSECGSHWLLLWDLSLLWNLFTKLYCQFRSGRLLIVYSSRSTSGCNPSANFSAHWSTYLNTSWLCSRRLSWWGLGKFIAWNETGTNFFDDGEVLGALGIVCLEYRSQIDLWRVLLLHEPLTQFFRWFVCTNCFKWGWLHVISYLQSAIEFRIPFRSNLVHVGYICCLKLKQLVITRFKLVWDFCDL